jgi:VWFA-related protein
MRALIASAGLIVFAAAPGAQEFLHFRSQSSDLVVVSASITDSDGGFVSDVTGEQFAIFDNGKRQPVVLFTNEDSPVSVGLIIDNSASMQPKTGEVVAAAIAFAKVSNPEDELFALPFNDSVQEAVHDERFLLAEDVDGLAKAVSSLQPEGQTALYDAIIAGLDRLEEGSRSRKVLIVLSDGGDNASRATLDEVIARARQSAATIYTIGLFDALDRDRNPGVLQRLARETGGERYLPASPGPLMQACQRIARDIRSGYTIGFEPSARDGEYHKLEVKVGQVNGRRLEVRTRTGYMAPRPGKP